MKKIRSEFFIDEYILNKKNNGFSAGYNQAVKLNNTEFSLVLGPDCIISEKDIIILFNGFIWGLNGFFVSYPLLILNSLILFFLSKKIIKIYKFKIHKHRVLKKIKSKVNSSNYKVDYAIFLSRYLVPFFFHNIFFGIFSKKFWKFLFFFSSTFKIYFWSQYLFH